MEMGTPSKKADEETKISESVASHPSFDIRFSVQMFSETTRANLSFCFKYYFKDGTKQKAYIRLVIDQKRGENDREVIGTSPILPCCSLRITALLFHSAAGGLVQLSIELTH
jgi:hypothetical protein